VRSPSRCSTRVSAIAYIRLCAGVVGGSGAVMLGGVSALLIGTAGWADAR
jgi:hypothetical protein